MKLKKLLAALFMVLILFGGISPVMAEDPLEPSAIPGTIEGTGTDFAVTDSEYLNVTLQSSVAITVQLESVPSMVVMHLEPVEGATTTQMTIGGLTPATTYYKYEGNYHNIEAITTDSSGSYTWMQDLSAPRQVWIQPNPSTKFINDATGGDCASIGTWDSGTKTCTLTMDVFETIQIDSDYVTLDGDGHLVQGTNSGYGVYLRSRTGVTVKNLVVKNFSYGILLYFSNNNTLTGITASINYNGIILNNNSSNNTLTGNNASNNSGGIILNYYSSNNTLTGNTASSNKIGGFNLNNNSNNNTLTGNTASINYIGIYLLNSNNTLTGNTVSNNYNHGIYVYNSNNNTLKGNTASNNNNGIRIYYSNNNTLTGNSIFENFYGINFSSAADSQTYNNLFIDNNIQARVSNSTGIVFSLAPPVGGNFWSDWTSPDGNNDGFVDSPYVFSGGQDDLPWAMPNGWLNQAPVADAGENIQITTAGQSFTVIQGVATDPDEDDLQYRWLEGVELLLDWSPIGAEGEAPLDLATVPYLEIGNHTLTLEVSDGNNTATDDMLLTIENSPPEVQPAPSSQVIEIGVDPVMIIADAADFDGDTLTYECLKDGEVLDSGSVMTIQGGDTVQIPDVVVPAGDPRFPLGTHVIEMRVNDGVNDPVSKYVSITVIDTTAPSLSPLPSITMLWPPNHSMRTVIIQANAFDNGGGIINLDVTVASSELPDFDGDGSTIPDYYIDSVDDSTGTIELQLRSERSGKGEGRTYTVNITASDESGNQSEAHVEIKAPHDKRKK